MRDQTHICTSWHAGKWLMVDGHLLLLRSTVFWFCRTRTDTTLGQPGQARSVQEGLRSLCGRTWRCNLTRQSSKPMGFTVFSKGCAHWRGPPCLLLSEAIMTTGPHPHLGDLQHGTQRTLLVHTVCHMVNKVLWKPKDKGLTAGCLHIFLVTYSGFSLEAQGHGLFLSPSQKSNLLFKNLFRTHNYN